MRKKLDKYYELDLETGIVWNIQHSEELIKLPVDIPFEQAQYIVDAYNLGFTRGIHYAQMLIHNAFASIEPDPVESNRLDTKFNF